jgi:ATP-binding cassette subfamily B protein
MFKSGLFSFIFASMKPQKWLFWALLLSCLLWPLDAVVWPYILRVVVDILTQFDGNRAEAWEVLKTPVFLGLFFWVFIEIAFRVQGFIRVKVWPKLEAGIRMKMFDHVQNHSPKYFNEHFAGSLANKITDMTTQVSTILDQFLYIFIPVALGCVLGLSFLFAVNPFFALILAVWLIVHFALCFSFAPNCNRLQNEQGEVRSTLLGRIVDSLTNNFAVNMFYRFAYEKSRIKRMQQDEQDKNIRAKQSVEVLRIYLGLATFLFAGVAINGYLIYFWLQGKISTGEFVQVFNITWNITLMSWMASWEIPILFQSLGVAQQAMTIMNDPQDVIDPVDAKPLTISNGEIRFENVTFKYGEKQLFRNKHVHIRGGEKVGLVGYSGAGKSSFVNLIMRFYPVDSGMITIDGQPIENVTLKSLRTQIALIPQDPLLFHRTLEENIRFGRVEASREEVVEAAKKAHCDEFIRKCSQGYETEVGERGTKLSGGERQRIAIARAMLANAPILILDEATSALDSMTERLIQESLLQLMSGRTTIVIAHRLSTLSQMDRILVFDKGKIVEEGSHAQLLEKNGHYARMWQMQAGGFLPDSPH